MKRNTLRRGGARLAIVAAIVLIAASCDVEDWAEGGELRPWFCDPTDTAVNDGHGDGHGHDHHGPHYTEEKGPLSAVDCMAIDIQLTVAADYAAQFPTAGDAEANGWHHLAPWIPGQGTHHVNIERGVTSDFNPQRPNMLMYDSNSDSGELTGMVWVVESEHPPEGFAGDNDHWHAHQTLCYAPGPFIVGDNISDAQCAARGGVNEDTSDKWMVHVWLPTYDGWEATDIFNKEHPSIN